MDTANLSDTAIILACIQRSQDRIVIKLAKHYNVHPAQIENEERIIYEINKITQETGMDDEVHNGAIANAKAEAKRKGITPFHISSFQQRQKQANQELQHLCTSISKRYGLGFNGEPKEFLIQLEMQIHTNPQLRENEAINAVYLELKATFPKISTAIMINQALQVANGTSHDLT